TEPELGPTVFPQFGQNQSSPGSSGFQHISVDSTAPSTSNPQSTNLNFETAQPIPTQISVTGSSPSLSPPKSTLNGFPYDISFKNISIYEYLKTNKPDSVKKIKAVLKSTFIQKNLF